MSRRHCKFGPRGEYNQCVCVPSGSGPGTLCPALCCCVRTKRNLKAAALAVTLTFTCDVSVFPRFSDRYWMERVKDRRKVEQEAAATDAPQGENDDLESRSTPSQVWSWGQGRAGAPSYFRPPSVTTYSLLEGALSPPGCSFFFFF